MSLGGGPVLHRAKGFSARSCSSERREGQRCVDHGRNDDRASSPSCRARQPGMAGVPDASGRSRYVASAALWTIFALRRQTSEQCLLVIGAPAHPADLRGAHGSRKADGNLESIWCVDERRDAGRLLARHRTAVYRRAVLTAPPPAIAEPTDDRADERSQPHPATGRQSRRTDQPADGMGRPRARDPGRGSAVAVTATGFRGTSRRREHEAGPTAPRRGATARRRPLPFAPPVIRQAPENFSPHGRRGWGPI